MATLPAPTYGAWGGCHERLYFEEMLCANPRCNYLVHTEKSFWPFCCGRCWCRHTKVMKGRVAHGEFCEQRRGADWNPRASYTPMPDELTLFDSSKTWESPLEGFSWGQLPGGPNAPEQASWPPPPPPKWRPEQPPAALEDAPTRAPSSVPSTWAPSESTLPLPLLGEQPPPPPPRGVLVGHDVPAHEDVLDREVLTPLRLPPPPPPRNDIVLSRTWPPPPPPKARHPSPSTVRSSVPATASAAARWLNQGEGE
mmetsp:Transcript_36457/g.79783  ORF Transcript_36457/g.79783 Transcript_36457/m.79783 type:complete len:254 (+) Transcript_36457:37-798(+)